MTATFLTWPVSFTSAVGSIPYLKSACLTKLIFIYLLCMRTEIIWKLIYTKQYLATFRLNILTIDNYYNAYFKAKNEMPFSFIKLKYSFKKNSSFGRFRMMYRYGYFTIRIRYIPLIYRSNITNFVQVLIYFVFSSCHGIVSLFTTRIIFRSVTTPRKHCIATVTQFVLQRTSSQSRYTAGSTSIDRIVIKYLLVIFKRNEGGHVV